MTKDVEVDFNVFVGAETGILKGVNVHSKGNIVKNFHNLKSLDKQFEITCASFGDGEGEILMGLRNQSVKVHDMYYIPSQLVLQPLFLSRQAGSYHRCMMLLSGHLAKVLRLLGAQGRWWELQGQHIKNS